MTHPKIHNISPNNGDSCLGGVSKGHAAWVKSTLPRGSQPSPLFSRQSPANPKFSGWSAPELQEAIPRNFRLRHGSCS
jgi:hypothetical protein